MDEDTAAVPRTACKVCGGHLRTGNTAGICTRSAGCRAAYAREFRKRNPEKVAASEQKRQRRPAPEPCEICGAPLNGNNKSGICARKGSLACQAERDRRKRALTAPEQRTCEVCGGPLRASSKTGICTTNRECARLADIKRRRAAGVQPRKTCRMSCDHPDGCPRPRWRGPYCDMHALRLEKTGKLGPVGPIPQRITVPAGTIYGCWTTMEAYDHAYDMVWCRCKCGRKRRVCAKRLRGALSTGCGCEWRESQSAAAAADPHVRAGERFGLLTALEDGPLASSPVLCRCDSGSERKHLAGNLRKGASRSCGCMRGATIAAITAANRTHGLSKHPLYGTWAGMISRCYNPASPSYFRWGGRGVRVYEPWRATPTEFIAWIEANLGPRPGGMTLDRYPDNDGNYEPGNVRWATKQQQTANRRTVDGVTRQRDAALAEVERLNEMLVSASRKREKPVPAAAQDALF